MAIIPRKAQKIFASNLTPTGNITEIGSTAAGSTVYTNDVATIQAQAAFTDAGFAGVTIGNQSPLMQDMNAFMLMLTQQLAYIFQAGLSEWDATTSYYHGSFCSNLTYPGIIFYSVQSGVNLNHAVTDTNWWLPIPLPAPSVASKGGLFSLAASGSQFLTGLDTAGNLTRRQPAYADITGLGTAATQATSAFDAAGAAAAAQAAAASDATAKANAALATSESYTDGKIAVIQPQICKAWASFTHQSGVLTILSSYNVASITNPSAGGYLVTFVTNMPNANYCVVGNATDSPNTTTNASFLVPDPASISAATVLLACTNNLDGLTDAYTGYFCIFASS